MKNKHFYQIFKLKIKPWIKYWLIKQTEFKGVLSDILEGISFYLTDSLNMKFKMFKIYGRTIQDGNPTPENPVPIKNTGDNVNEFDKDNVTYKDGYILNADGTETSNSNYGYTTSFIDVKPNTKYTIQGNMNNSSSSSRIYYYDKNNTFISRSDAFQTINTSYTFETPSNCTKIQFQYVRSVVDFSTIKIEQGTKATPYSPYGCGNVNEKVQNKNLFDEDTVTFTVGVLDDNGNPTGSTASHYTNNFYQVTPNTNYTLKGTLNTGSSSGRIYYYDKDKKWISRSESFGSNQKNFTTPEKCYYIKIQVVVSITLKTGDVQLEQGSTSTEFQPHSEQNLSFPLSSGQKFYEGSYPDDDEKVHHKRKQFTLDGSQLMSKFIYNSNLSTTNYSCFLYNDNEIKQATNDTEVFVLADKLKGTPSNQRTSDMANCWINHLSTGQLGMHVPNTITNTTELKTWLTENPITFEVPLAEETTEDFTEEQKTAWEEIKKARTYKNITHISSEDETPAELKIQYWKEV